MTGTSPRTSTARSGPRRSPPSCPSKPRSSTSPPTRPRTPATSPPGRKHEHCLPDRVRHHVHHPPVHHQQATLNQQTPPKARHLVNSGGPSLCPIGGTLTTIHHGDCIQVMHAMPPESVDAIVTDPPYGLGFMGKKWDGLPPSLEWAEACYRVLKPGGHIAAFGGTRTWHRLAVAIEDAGFEMRDSLAWLYGSGFPKSHDVGKAIDKAAGAEREVIGFRPKVNNAVS